ncbi:MAG: sugar ABC transporter permease [Lachnospiraceae bacterium]|jgi:raffinose/stachyose/melibiose transport system permease protein|nr:sugar ABC transporter permease [Lachnospiraceae bacterium]
MNHKKIYPSYFILLPLILYVVLFILPSAMGLALSFTDWNSVSDEIHFVGLSHFIEIFTNSRYLIVIRNTLIFAIITTLFKNVIGLGMALVLNKEFKTRNILRTIFFFPVMLSPLIIGLVFKSIYNPEFGVINEFLRAIGMNVLAKDWLGDIGTALGAVIIVEIWRLVGQNMVIYVAGLQAISDDYLEAADIDGAGKFQKLIYVILPQMLPSITINLVLNLIAGLKVFDLVFVLTNGGPARMTEVLNTLVYKEYSSGRYGFSTALGFVMFVFTCIVAFSVLKAMSKEEE